MVHLDKTKNYALYNKFQERGISHVHLFLWIFSSSNIQNEDLYSKFTEKTINAELPDYLNDAELFEFIRNDQVHIYFKT